MKSLFLTLICGLGIHAMALPSLESCVKNYALDQVQEYNLPNDYLFSANQKDLDDVLNVIDRMGYSKAYVAKAHRVAKDAHAVGVVINYQDEIHLIYVAANIVDNECEVSEIADINIVDVSYNNSLTEKDADKFFLNKPVRDVPEDIYNELISYLKEQN